MAHVMSSNLRIYMGDPSNLFFVSQVGNRPARQADRDELCQIVPKAMAIARRKYCNLATA